MTDTTGPVGNDPRSPGNSAGLIVFAGLIVGLIDKHLTRATKSREMLERYAFLAIVLTLCALGMVAGSAFIMTHLQMRVSTASGIACGGVFTFIGAAATTAWRARRKSDRDRRE